MPKPFALSLIPSGTRSEALKRKCERIAAWREEKARARYLAAKYVAEGLAPRTADGPHRSLREKAELVCSAIAGGLLSPLTPRSHEALRDLEHKWHSGQRSIVDYMERVRTGRRRGEYDARLVEEIDEAVRKGSFLSIRELTLRIARRGEELGVDSRSIPKYDAVAHMVRAHGPMGLFGARYGSRMAELRGQAHGTFACLYSNEYFTVDEAKAPFRYQAYDWVVETIVSIRPSIIAVRDYKSGATLGYHISDPTRRLDLLTGRPMREGYDAADVFAALAAAALPEVSPPATRRTAGHLPSRGIRWDNIQQHKTLGLILNDLGRAIDAPVETFFGPEGAPSPAASAPTSSGSEGGIGAGNTQSADQELGSAFITPARDAEGNPLPPTDLAVRTPRMRVRFPKSRGDVEGLLKYLKWLCSGMDGHIDRVTPLDCTDEDPAHERTDAASKGEVEPRREIVPPAALPTREQQCAAFDRLVRLYNTEHRNRVHQRSPLARYHQFLPRQSRKGRDLLLALQPRTGFVQGNGIVVYHEGCEYRYTNYVEDRFVLQLGARVDYRVDPLMRGIWADIDGQTYYLPLKEVWAAERGRGKQMSQQGQALARDASDRGAAARAAEIDAKHGAGAAAGFREFAATQRLLQQEVKRAVAAADRAARDAAAAVAALEASRVAPRGHQPMPETDSSGAPVADPARRGARTRGAKSANRAGRSRTRGGASATPTPAAPLSAAGPAVEPESDAATDSRPDGLDPTFDPMTDPGYSRAALLTRDVPQPEATPVQRRDDLRSGTDA